MSHANQVNQTPAPSIHLIHVTNGALDMFYLLTGELGTENCSLQFSRGPVCFILTFGFSLKGIGCLRFHARRKQTFCLEHSVVTSILRLDVDRDIYRQHKAA